MWPSHDLQNNVYERVKLKSQPFSVWYPLNRHTSLYKPVALTGKFVYA